jgi:hypothetical protein
LEDFFSPGRKTPSDFDTIENYNLLYLILLLHDHHKKSSPFTKRTAKVGRFKIISKTFFKIPGKKSAIYYK